MERPHFFKVRSGKITVCTMCRTKVWIDIKVFGGEEQFNHSRHMFPIKQKFYTKAFLDNQKKTIWSILENCWDKCANRMHYLQNWPNWNIFIIKFTKVLGPRMIESAPRLSCLFYTNWMRWNHYWRRILITTSIIKAKMFLKVNLI